MAEVDDSRGFGSNSLGIEGVESVEKKKENPGFLKSLANVFDSVSNGVMLGGGYIVYKLLDGMDTMTSDLGALIVSAFVASIGIVGTAKQLSEKKLKYTTTLPAALSCLSTVAAFEHRQPFIDFVVQTANSIHLG
ncbi:MAG: hypothetical protein CMH30_01125 [Micavibrio sp.]|nr:hypothetical protein [Micavibrio sp.]|tara:strand:+ start:423 stop:827 length:405 start_codon:yes stop_codon:yes gene_type:complete